MKKQRPVRKNKKRRAKNLYFLLVVLLCAFTVGMGYITEKLDLMATGDDTVISGEQDTSKEIIFEEEDLEMMQAIDSAGSLNDFLYHWANNGGELYSSKNVINVLLVGLDSKEGLKYGGNSDSLILVSLNKKTKKIYMTSFFRDTWCYMNIGGEDRYAKLNSSYFYGGSVALIDTIEKNFKIDIDYYVAVDFSSFVDIIGIIIGAFSNFVGSSI